MASDNVFNITDVRDTSAVLMALAQAGPEGIYHVVSSPPVTRTTLAELVKASSQFGDLMGFDYVGFDELERVEHRPKKSWFLNEKVVQHLDVQFIHPEKVVREKTKLIDHWIEKKVI